MTPSLVHLIYFSPTGTTRKILGAIAEGVGAPAVAETSMTQPEAGIQSVPDFTDELVVLGAPVYAGRIPDDAVRRFRRLRAKNTPAILVVVYGNREYEDALLELRDLSLELGFLPVAGGAFIGEHSYSTPDAPIASGRPDLDDIERAAAFGKAALKKLSGIQFPGQLPPLNVSGNFPYKNGMPAFPKSPKTNMDACTLCGLCATVCPVAAVTVSDDVVTDPDVCIACCACVKSCPVEARFLDDPFISGVAKWLSENCIRRKEPEIFL